MRRIPRHRFLRSFPSITGFVRHRPALHGIAFAALSGMSASMAHADVNITLPQDYPRGTNLLSSTVCSPTFSGGATSWVFSSDGGTPTLPAYDASDSVTSGSGSIKFPAMTSGVTTANFFSKLTSCSIGGIAPNKPYTVSFYMKAPAAGTYVEAVLFMFDASNNSLGYTKTKMAAVSIANTWQEVTGVFTAPNPATASVRIGIETVYTGSSRPELSVDDVYLGEGVSFAARPLGMPSETRKTFNGPNQVKIDEWGNWQTYDDANDAWNDFFPFGLYPDLARPDYDSLSRQGFNLVMSQQFASQIEHAQSAVSTEFNPQGMYACLRLAAYAKPGDSTFNLTNLPGVITDLTGGSLARTLLCYDWDNEKNWTNGAQWTSMTSLIHTDDTKRPIYVLNGYPAVQRAFYSLSDVAGTYVDFDTTESAGNFEVLQNLPGQRTPASIAQINEVENTSYGFRLRVYDALIRGARGIVYWGDGKDNVADEVRHVEYQAWWCDVKKLRREIDQLLPLLKQPYGVSWTAASSDADILVGRRDLNGEGYLIVANPKGTATRVVFTLSGITPSEVWNYFDDTFIALVQGGQFTVDLPAHSTAVYRLSNNTYPEILQNVGMETTGSPLPQWGVTGVTALTQDGTEKYAGSYSAKITNSTVANTTYLQYYAALQPGKHYRFSAMVKTDSVSPSSSSATDGALIQLYALGGINQFLSSPALTGTQDWQLIQSTFTAPSPACLGHMPPDCASTDWYVRLRLWNASGEVWFDNVSLKELP